MCAPPLHPPTEADTWVRPYKKLSLIGEFIAFAKIFSSYSLSPQGERGLG